MASKQQGQFGTILSVLLLPYDLLRVFIIFFVYHWFGYAVSGAYKISPVTNKKYITSNLDNQPMSNDNAIKDYLNMHGKLPKGVTETGRPQIRWYHMTASLIMWALLFFFTGRALLYEKWDVVMACPQYTNSDACYEEEAYYEGGEDMANAYTMLTFQKEIIRDIDYCDGNLCYLDNESRQAYTLKKIGTKYYWLHK